MTCHNRKYISLYKLGIFVCVSFTETSVRFRDKKKPRERGDRSDVN